VIPSKLTNGGPRLLSLAKLGDPLLKKWRGVLR
jgi:hypothetical protein